MRRLDSVPKQVQDNNRYKEGQSTRRAHGSPSDTYSAACRQLSVFASLAAQIRTPPPPI